MHPTNSTKKTYVYESSATDKEIQAIKDQIRLIEERRWKLKRECRRRFLDSERQQFNRTNAQVMETVAKMQHQNNN